MWLLKKLTELTREQCWGITQKGERCKNIAKKGQLYCIIHEGQIPTIYIRIKFLIRKYLKIELGTIGILLTIFIIYHQIVDPRLSLSINSLGKDIRYVQLEFKNESSITDIKDINIRFKSVYSQYEEKGKGIATIHNMEIIDHTIDGLNISSIEKIEPKRKSSTIYYPVINNDDNFKLLKEEVCIYIKYKVWFFSINDEYGMYINPTIKLNDWIQRSCNDLPHNTG